MKLFISLLRVLSLVALATIVAAKSPAEYEKQFAEWMTKHRISFDDIMEYAKRLEIFIANDLFITSHNSQLGRSYSLDHNEFSHLTFDEFQRSKLGFRMPESVLQERLSRPRNPSSNSSVNVPDSIDWVKKGAVTPVKNQGQCGSCWAFSTTGATEGAVFISSGKLVSLSEQELVDCDHNGDHGCNGGLMDHAFDWIKEQGGLCAEDEYEYEAKEGVCRTCHPVVEVTGHHDVDANDEDALKIAVAQQPVSVAIEADQRAFQFYRSGVFDSKCGTQLDHGVLVVGYGEENGKKFWKVKNSWGSTWGEEGFIKLSRGNGNPSGQCGVAMVPSYPNAKLVSHNLESPEDETQGNYEPKRSSNAETLGHNGDRIAMKNGVLVVEEVLIHLDPKKDQEKEGQAARGNVYEFIPGGY